MSISRAPARAAVSASARLTAVELAPSGKPDHRADLHRRARQFGRRHRNPVRIDADAGEGVFPGFGAQAEDVVARGLGFEQRVIDQRGDLGIDARQTRAARHAVRAGGEYLLSVLRAGLRAALDAVRGTPDRAG